MYEALGLEVMNVQLSMKLKVYFDSWNLKIDMLVLPIFFSLFFILPGGCQIRITASYDGVWNGTSIPLFYYMMYTCYN